MKRILLGIALAWLAGIGLVQAQDFSALARVEPARSHVRTVGGKTEIALGISQPVPFRAYLLDGPPRLVVDFREVDVTGSRRTQRRD